MASHEPKPASDADHETDHKVILPIRSKSPSPEPQLPTENQPEDTHTHTSGQSISITPTEHTTPTQGEPSTQIQNADDVAGKTEKAADAGEANDTGDGDLSLVASRTTKAPLESSFHRRIDSVPPQKYDLAHETSTELPSSLASTSLRSPIEEDLDISMSHDQDTTDPTPRAHSPGAFDSYQQDGSPVQLDVVDFTNSATEENADLNFVDVTLDNPINGAPSDNNLEPGHPLAGSTRTAEQIRQDSVSSGKPPGNGSPQTTPPQEIPNPTLHATSSNRKLSPPTSPDQGNTGTSDRAVRRRSAEGRYRGRTSVPSSRDASPAGSPSRSPSRRSSFAPSNVPSSPVPNAGPSRSTHSLNPTPVLLASDEHGNISVSDIPVSPRTVPQTLAPDERSGDDEKPEPAKDANNASTTELSASARDAEEAAAPTSPSKSTVILNGRAATSLSEEVEVAAATEVSEPSVSEAPEPADSSLSVSQTNGDVSTISSSPGLSDKADQVDAKTRRKSSSAANDGVESRTRMTTLPAKPKTEEIKHRADFERMMMAAKEIERKKREQDEEKKRRRHDEQREALARWEKEILPSWSRARKDPELAELWWKGAPPSIRGRIWALAIGNPLMLSRNLLEQSEKKAAGSDNKPIEKVIPPRILAQIEDDAQDALPSLKLFQENGPLHDDLVRLLRAFVLVRMEQVAELDVAGDADRSASRHQNASPINPKVDLPPIAGAVQDGSASSSEAAASPEAPAEEDEYSRRGIDIYQPGLSGLAAVLLINMPINTAFIALLNLLSSKSWLKALYSLLPNTLPPTSPSKPPAGRKTAAPLARKEKAIRGFERVLETLLADQMPKVYANLLAHSVRMRIVLRDWVRGLWSQWLDVDTVMRLWDVVLLDETDSMIYRVCLALVQMLEARLYVPDQQELESVLRGTNKAALGVWRRDKEASGELGVHIQTTSRKSKGSASSTTEGMPQKVHSSSSLASDKDSDDADKPPVAPPRSSSLAQIQPPNQPDSALDTDLLDVIVPRDYIYEQYAITEDRMFDTLDAQKSWWKQSTLQRLLDRELSE